MERDGVYMHVPARSMATHYSSSFLLYLLQKLYLYTVSAARADAGPTAMHTLKLEQNEEKLSILNMRIRASCFQ